MELKLKRIHKEENYTIGKLYINDKWFCDTIEDKVRILPPKCKNTTSGSQCHCKEKIYAQTAIPPGIYKITMEYSPKFKRVLPFLHNVPHFTGILIHPGTDETSSAGCIIIGKNRVKGKVLESRVTSDTLNTILSQEKEITITIE